jgi:hypothetical protein
LLNDSQHYEAPECQECEACGEEWDQFMELETCADCGEECCLKCTIEWFELTVCYECITELYTMTGKEAPE